MAKKLPTDYPPRHTTGISLSKNFHDELRRIAEYENRTISNMIRTLIKEALMARLAKRKKKEHEKYLRRKQAVKEAAHKVISEPDIS